MKTSIKIIKVAQSGAMRWKSYYWAYLTFAFKSKYIETQKIGNGIWKVFYRNVFLGFFDEKNTRNKRASTRLSQNIV